MGAYGNTSQATSYSIYPIITSVVPARGYVNTEYTLTLSGNHFGSQPDLYQLRINGMVITDIESWQDHKIVCRAWFSDTGEKAVTLIDASDQRYASPQPIRVYPQEPLVLTGDVSGTIVQGLTYRASGHIRVPRDQVLVIESGVSILFDGSDNGEPYGFVVNGTLYANGTQDHPIHMTTMDERAGAYWTFETNAGWNTATYHEHKPVFVPKAVMW